MSTLTLGIVVIIYMFILAWLGYIGYKPVSYTHLTLPTKLPV